MRAYRLTAPGRAELCEVPVPGIADTEVLVQVAAVGVCHSDLHLCHARALPYALPMTLGHEVSGHVVRVGRAVTTRHVGEAVLVYLSWGCGTCAACRSGAENYCRAHHGSSVPGPGMGHDGGMAEFVAVPARHLVPLDGLDPVTAAPLADAALTSFHAIEGARDRLVEGSTAVVIGVGGLGNLAVQILAATTGARIIAVDPDAGRRGLAQESGAHVCLDSADAPEQAITDLTGGSGAEAVFDFVGVESTLGLAASCVGTQGVVSIVGLGAGRLPVLAGPPPFAMPWGVSILRPYGGSRENLHAVLDLARSGRLRAPVEVAPLREAPAVLDRLEQGLVQGRAVLVP